MTNELAGWSVPLPALKKLAPKADPLLLEFMSENILEWAPKFGFRTKNSIHEFIAQGLEESQHFTRFEENLNYTSAARLRAVWPSRFRDVDPTPYVRNPQRLANFVYANRMGNGNAASNDGWTFRGRGIFMATGRDNYGWLSNELDEDFLKRPELVASPQWVFPSALAIGKRLKLGETEGIVADTLRLNGGKTNLENRKALLVKVKKLIP